MKLSILILIILIFTINSCTSIRESAGVNRKSHDEFTVVENPPLVIPPDFNLLPPEQLQEKNLNNLEKDLAKDILFGISKEDVAIEQTISTMNDILLQSDALNTPTNIRKEIDEDFFSQINTESIFSTDFETQVEVLDAIKESERIRNQNFEGESISEGKVPIKVKTLKNKKKKRFILF